ncbi:MAG TPA: alpha/beta hydrolase, partial [Draconibacterium sp.]|nr:alpha/beta hydrolase [Draconibacterium sp.]
MRRIFRFLAFVVLIFVIVYLMGPKPPQVNLNKDLPSISASIANIEDYVKKNDKGLRLKPDNESRIIWANDSVKERTTYSLLYLHGFSASWYEGYPTNIEFARYFGCNAYFPRLASHGIETEDALIDMTPDRLWESAKDALMIARTLGRKVIIMGTSTGGTLALKLAADFPEYVDGLILYSPNIRINNKAAFLLSKPWGLQIGQKAEGGKYRISEEEPDSKYCKYWNCKYRMEAVVFLQQLVDETMINQTYKNITEPVFLGYYYKDETHQDDVVKVDAMLKMYDHLGTPAGLKVKVAFPEAGDHVIGCEFKSGACKEVLAETVKFGEE